MSEFCKIHCYFPYYSVLLTLLSKFTAEAERIRKCKGRVFSLQDEPDVARVWMPKNDSPGLAMARAFGDFCLKDFGVISVPEISYRRLSEKDEFIVVATDGVFHLNPALALLCFSIYLVTSRINLISMTDLGRAFKR